MDLTVRDWEQIAQTPVLVFAVVAMADRSVSDEELTVFVDHWMPKLQEFVVNNIDHDRVVFHWALTDAARNWKKVALLGEAKILEELELGLRTVDRFFTAEAAAVWKDELRALGTDVAEASRGLFGLGEAIDKRERRVLGQLRYLLEDRPVL